MANDLEREDELWHGGYSAKDMAGAWVIAGLITIAALVACVIIALPPLWMAFLGVAAVVWMGLLGTLAVRKLSIDYRLTSQRLIRKTGLLSRKTGRVEVIDIDDITVEQGLFQRLFGVGRIRVHSSDVSDPVLWMLGIADPAHVAETIDKARRAERVKRGVHVAQI
jgi:uncharacterized membrane protein YdbT with pleckstrin-like domain